MGLARLDDSRTGRYGMLLQVDDVAAIKFVSRGSQDALSRLWITRYPAEGWRYQRALRLLSVLRSLRPLLLA